MLDKRLKKESDFNEVFKKGKRSFSKSLTMIFLKKDSLKIGITVGKKYGSAVKRNRIKRLLRACYLPQLEFLKNYYIVFLPKIREEYDFETFKKDINYLLKKENLINEKDPT